MNKPLVFISHIHEEKEIANEFKIMIQDAFLNMFEVFISSNEASIAMGQRWLDEVTKNLQNCVIEIVVCSPISLRRPWINFEAGAGWIREIPVIPLCHSGLEPSSLPIPLNLLQSAKANELSNLKLIIPVLANAIGCEVPKNIDYDSFIQKVKDFEYNYTFGSKVKSNLEFLSKINPMIVHSLKNSNSIELDLTLSEIDKINDQCEFLLTSSIIGLEHTGKTKIGSLKGITNSIKIYPIADTKLLFKDLN